MPVGMQDQLFLDDWIVEKASGLERVLHRPKKAGLIREADGRPWERGSVSSVFRDREGRFHMAYSLRWFDEDALEAKKHFPPEGFRTLNGYAVSDDGVRWRKPVLGLAEGPTGFERAPDAQRRKGVFWRPTGWSTQNNLGYPVQTVRDVGQFGGVSDPQRRYMIQAGGMYFAPEPPDVLGDPQWRERLTPEPYTSPRGSVMGWDEGAGVWLATGQTSGWQGSGQGRIIGRWTSLDLVSWSDEVVLPVAEDESREPGDWVEYYCMGGYRVGDLWLGLLHPYHTDRTNPLYGASHMDNVWMKGTTEVRLMTSRDAGHTWQRVAGKQPWLPHHPDEGGYDRTLYAGSPVRVGDELWMYYRADDGDHLTFFKDNTPCYPDRMPIGRTALATLRWDGYVSMKAKDRRGALVTKPFALEGPALHVNADARRGELRVEVLDGAGRPVDGLAAADSRPITSDGLRHDVQWVNGTRLADARGTTVRLRFHLSGAANLYGFGIDRRDQT